MNSFHWQKQHEHGPAPACGASVCPGAESSVAGSASLPAPTRRLSDLGLISRPRPRDQDRDKAWLKALCTGKGRGVEGQRTQPQQHLPFVDLNRV